MTSEERAHIIVAAIVELCHLDLGDKRQEAEACLASHLDEFERATAERSVAVIREKAGEASEAVLSRTAIGSPTIDPEVPGTAPSTGSVGSSGR